MPNLRPTELIIILLIIVLLFGAKKLPELAKSIGQSMKIFRAETKTDDPATQQTVNTVSDAPAPAPAAAPAPAVPQAVTMNATAAPTTATGAEQR
jgi:sec-independent protein translocase protein TatA